MDIENSIRLSRAYAAKELSWFSPALYRCRIVLTEQVPVAAIDKHFNIYWNPKATSLIINSTTDKKRALSELAFIWVHEISHVLREHFNRATYISADRNKWNYAADLEINDSAWKGLAPPRLFPPLMPNQYELPIGRTAEWYYNNLPEEYQSIKIWDDGSGAHGLMRPWEIEDQNPQSVNDIARVVFSRDVARRMKAQKPGTIPGSWGAWIKNTLEPKIDWRKVLRNRLSTAITIGRGSRIDYTFTRVNRRSTIYRPVILPSLSGAQSSQLVVVIDTSGSMMGQPLEQAVGELYGILKEAHQSVKLIPCDTQEYDVIELQSAADIRRLLKLPGGGGTNMIRGIEFAMKQKPVPDTVLVLTDGYTPYPREKYKIPVLYGIVGSNSLAPTAMPPNPPWGEDSYVFIDLGR
ncbi:MAG: VWA-like domain-containing protein [Bacteroidota bacterium]